MKFETNNIIGEISFVYDKTKISGKINDTVKDSTLYYKAASPPDRRCSFTGSGLPYATEEMAFYNTPNKGFVELKENNTFEFYIFVPSAYYKNLGNDIIDPTIYFKYHNGSEYVYSDVVITKRIPFRSLTYNQNRTSPDFYENDYGVKTQEAILIDRGYPKSNNIMNYWKPSLV